MERKARLLERLNEIGKGLESKDGAILLLGVGSVGIEMARMDDYSDLDFFVIVKNGYKPRFIENLDWLEEVHPLAYSFPNTEAGCKILFEDGLYGEYAVFEEEETPHISYWGGRVVWTRSKTTFTMPVCGNTPNIRKEALDHPLNEALTNLFVGLGRYARGEKLSAARFVQSYAVDSILSILHLVEQEADDFPDPFGNERRIEKRFPRFAALLPSMVMGYNRTPESALAILAYLESIYPANRRMAQEIRTLAQTLLNA